ncbi:uncharacterized protein NPIL_458611 [Nephila pilipes]|uniref:Uncharacterized protein n=1 Tax=Nephila pilipes TaxID=299642 RepID=A0A8X6Q6S4_NEPPI|nr:uncharacterized protein NPIL_633571 [Nephila pilipes]GFU09628.1 uncharacterized protein NPIL_458611 [Nephila pilipes]
MNRIFPFVSPLLTLESINNSQEEMLYITRMRNVIKFQIETSDDYELLRIGYFRHKILCLRTITSTLKTCLSHTLSNIVKSHVLVHNVEPFLQWWTISIEDDGFPDRKYAIQSGIRVWKTVGSSKDGFLVATITNCAFIYVVNTRYNWADAQLFTSTTLDSIRISAPANDVNSINHTWRRVYDSNCTLFSCSENDIAAFVKEQMTRRTKPVNILKQVMKRAEEGSFNEYQILKVIASPYYYELPHQNEQEYFLFTTDNSWSFVNPLYVIFTFESRLNFGMKNIENFVSICSISN